MIIDSYNYISSLYVHYNYFFPLSSQMSNHHLRACSRLLLLLGLLHLPPSSLCSRAWYSDRKKRKKERSAIFFIHKHKPSLFPFPFFFLPDANRTIEWGITCSVSPRRTYRKRNGTDHQCATQNGRVSQGDLIPYTFH